MKILYHYSFKLFNIGDDKVVSPRSEQSWNDIYRWNDKAIRGECFECNGGRKIETHESGYGYKVCERCNGRKFIGPHRRIVLVYADQEAFALHSVLESQIDRLFRMIDETPQLDWIVTTSNPHRAVRMIPTVRTEVASKNMPPRPDYAYPDYYRHNVWLGAKWMPLEGMLQSHLTAFADFRNFARVAFVDARGTDYCDCRVYLDGPVDSRANWILASDYKMPPPERPFAEAMAKQAVEYSVPLYMPGIQVTDSKVEFLQLPPDIGFTP